MSNIVPLTQDMADKHKASIAARMLEECESWEDVHREVAVNPGLWFNAVRTLSRVHLARIEAARRGGQARTPAKLRQLREASKKKRKSNKSPID